MIDNILKYQKIDGQIRQIEKQLNESDNKKRGRQLSVYLRDCEDNLKKMDERSKELNILLSNQTQAFEDKEQLIAEYEKIVKTTKDLQEIDYLSKKVAELQKSIFAAEKEISALMQEIEDISKQYDVIRSKYPVAIKQYKECKQAFEQESQQRQPEIHSLKQELASAAKDIKPELLEKFQKLKSQGVYPPFVVLVGSNQCGGCQMEIPSGIVNGLQEKGYIVCENCHRLVFKQN